MSDEPVTVEVDGRVATLTLNRPDSRNALDDETAAALVDALDRVNRDAGLSCLILTGAGPAFCAGGSIKDMREKSGLFGGTPARMRHAYLHGIQQIPLAMWRLEVPAIAAVNGPAVGAGCDLAMMCDLRIASPAASFAESFLRVGLISGDGGAWFLPRVVGLTRACHMAYTGESVPAGTAERWGAVLEVVPDAELMPRARAIAAQIAAQPPQALRMTKRLIREGMTSTLAQNLELAAAMQPLAQTAADHAEAVAALFEKRPPQFRGE